MGIKGDALYVSDGSATGGKLNSLSEAMAKEASCGCGTVCDDCYSYQTLKDFNSTTGVYSFKAVYLVDGAWKIDTIANAKLEMQGYKDLRG